MLTDTWIGVTLIASVVTESFRQLGGYNAGTRIFGPNYYQNPCPSYYTLTTTPLGGVIVKDCYHCSVNISDATHGCFGVYAAPAFWSGASINYIQAVYVHLDFSDAMSTVRLIYGTGYWMTSKAGNPYENQDLNYNFGGRTGFATTEDTGDIADRFAFNHGLDKAYKDEASSILHLGPNLETGSGGSCTDPDCPSSGSLFWFAGEKTLNCRCWQVTTGLDSWLIPSMNNFHFEEKGEPVVKVETEPPDSVDAAADSGETDIAAPTGGSNSRRRGTSYDEDQVSWEDTTSYDRVYIPATVDVASQDGIVISYDILAGSGSILNQGVYIETIKQSLIDIDEMIFVQSTKYDKESLLDVGDKVFGLVKGVTKFIGYVDSIDRHLSESEQFIKYHAAGLRKRLYDLPFAYEYRFENIYLHTAFKKIIDTIPSSIVNWSNISVLPTNILLPSLDLTASSLGQALDMLLDYAGRYGYHIDHTYKLTVYDLKNLSTIKNLTVATEGEKLSDHSEYIVYKQNLNLNTSNCKTRCMIKGDYPEIEVIEEVRPQYETRTVRLDNGRTHEVKFAKFQVHKNILEVIAIVGKTVITWSGWGTKYMETVFDVNVRHVDKAEGVIWTDYVGPLAVYTIQYIYRGNNPITVDTGWQGTAYTQYGIQQTLIKEDTRFKKSTVDGLNRDDTNIMSAYAHQLLERYKDAKVGGNVVCDGLQVDFITGSCCNILGTEEDWSNLKAAVLSVTYDIPHKTTTLELTNNYYLGSGTPDLHLLHREIYYEKLRTTDEFRRRQIDLKMRVKGPDVHW